MEKDEQLVVGFIRGPHGVTGEFKVESASGDYEHIEKLKEVTLRHGSDSKKCKVELAEEGCGTLYMKVTGIDSPEEVRKYNGWELVVDRKYAHPLGKNEWYIKDLIGCSLIWNGEEAAAGTAPTEIVGTITDVLEGGAGYLLEVSLSENCDRKVFVPFNKEFIGKVDVENKTVQLMHLWILE